MLHAPVDRCRAQALLARARDGDVRCAALSALGAWHAVEVRERIRELLHEGEERVVDEARSALERLEEDDHKRGSAALY
jgi:hypothetical protein